MQRAIQLEKEIQIHQKIRSLAAKTQLWTGSLVNRVVSVPREANISHPSVPRAHDMIPALGIIMGAVAFGFWWHSIAAGLFAGFGLFFLAGIYKAMERIVGVVVRWERDRMVGANPNRDAPTGAEPSHGDIEALSGAIDLLKPWVADEIPLTEENVKASCAVLLEFVAPSHTNKAQS
jgi:hypothetical protein